MSDGPIETLRQERNNFRVALAAQCGISLVLRHALENALRVMVDDWAGNPVHDRAAVISEARRALSRANPQEEET